MSAPGQDGGTPQVEPTPTQRELDRARAAFEVGDNRLVREIAAPLLRADDEQVRAEAEALLARIRVDPFTKWIGVGTLLLLLLVIYWYVVK